MTTDNLKAQIDAAFSADPLHCYTRLIGCTHESRTGSDYIFRPAWWNHEGSIKVNAQKNAWFANAAESGGDHYKLYAIRHGMDAGSEFKAVVEGLAEALEIRKAGRPGPANQESAATNNSTSAIPPATVKKKEPPIKQQAASAEELATKQRAAGFWIYHNADGSVHGVAIRQNKGIKPDGKIDKSVLQWCYNGGNEWTCEWFPNPRILYNLHLLTQRATDTVLLFEGEKTADAGNAQAKAGFVAVTWAGGVNGRNSADFRPLHTRKVIAIPDNDPHAAGLTCMRRICGKLAAKGCDISLVEYPPDFPKNGWDVADPWPDGWNLEKLLALAKPYTTPDGLRVEHDIRSQPFSDSWNAVEMHARFQPSLLWCPEWSDWCEWDGKRWKRGAELEALEAAKETARCIRGNYANDPEAKKSSTLRKLENLDKMRAMMNCAKPLLQVSAERFDADPWLLNCRNGVLDLRTGVLNPHNAARLITKVAGCEYDPDAPAERWLDFVRWFVCGDLELLTFLQRMAGYSLTGRMDARKFVVLYGGGDNGKTVFVQQLMHVLGDYAVTGKIETFTKGERSFQADGKAANPDVAFFDGARLIYTAELGKTSTWNEPFIKNFTGGDTLQVRKNYGDPYTLIPQGKLWFTANDLPRTISTTDSFWNRMQIVPCMNVATVIDEQLPEKLHSESAGILAWAVAGCLEWQREGIQIPAAVRNATGRTRAEFDTIEAFLHECCQIAGPELRTQPTILYNAYLQYCEMTAREPMSQTAFGKALDSKGFEGRKFNGNRVRIGVSLLQETISGSGRDGFCKTPLARDARAQDSNVTETCPNPSTAGICTGCGTEIEGAPAVADMIGDTYRAFCTKDCFAAVEGGAA